MDTWKVAVLLEAKNGISTVMAVIAKDALKLQGSVNQIGASFAAWKPALLGAVGVLAGAAMVKGLANIAQHGEKLLDQQDKLQRAGLQYADVLKLQASYYDRIAKSVPTSTASDYLKTVNELRAVTGSTAGAADLAPKAMMVDTLLSNTLGREVHGEYYKLLRSAEMKGISTNPARLEQFTDQVFSMITAFGGKLTAEDFQTLARRGGTAFMNAKPESIGPLGVLAADLGGSAAGTTLMTLQNLQTGANTLTKQQAKVLTDLGLLDMSKAVATGFGGGRLQLAPGAIKGSLEHMGDLPGWIRDTVYPALVKASHGDEALLQNLIAKISPNRNAAKLIEMFGNPKFLDQQMKDLGLAGQIESIPDAYKHFTERNPLGVKKAFWDQYESMMQAVGSPLMQAALPVMRGVTDMFTSIGAAANRNSGNITAVLDIIKQFGSIAYTIGSFGVEKLWAITGVSGLFRTLAEIPWEKLSGGLADLQRTISGFVDSITALYGKLSNPFGGGKGESPPAVDDYGRPLHKSSFNPALDGGRGGSISVNLNVDGRSLGAVVIDQIQKLTEFSTGAGGFNAGGRFPLPDNA